VERIVVEQIKQPWNVGFHDLDLVDVASKSTECVGCVELAIVLFTVKSNPVPEETREVGIPCIGDEDTAA